MPHALRRPERSARPPSVAHCSGPPCAPTAAARRQFVSDVQDVNRHAAGVLEFERAGLGARSFARQGDPSQYRASTLLARARLRTDRRIAAWLERYYDTFVDRAPSGITVAEYNDVHLKLYKALVNEADWNARDACRVVARDCEAATRATEEAAVARAAEDADGCGGGGAQPPPLDGGGGGGGCGARVDRETFCDGLFQLADVWTTGTAASEYEGFLRCLFLRVTHDPKARRSIGGRAWRALDDVNFADAEEPDDAPFGDDADAPREAETTLPPIGTREPWPDSPRQQVLLERAARGRAIRERWKRGALAAAMQAKPKNPFGIGGSGGMAALVKAAAATAVQDDPAEEKSQRRSKDDLDVEPGAGAVREPDKSRRSKDDFDVEPSAVREPDFAQREHRSSKNDTAT